MLIRTSLNQLMNRVINTGSNNVTLTVVLSSPVSTTGGSKRINLGGRPGRLPVPNLFLLLPRPRPLDLSKDSKEVVKAAVQ